MGKTGGLIHPTLMKVLHAACTDEFASGSGTTKCRNDINKQTGRKVTVTRTERHVRLLNILFCNLLQSVRLYLRMLVTIG